jgi:hypothetical protein
MRAELWTLELARSIGRKSEEIDKLKKEREYSQQEISHLKLQVDELSRLQHPREFRLSRPETLPIDSRMVSAMVENTYLMEKNVGWSMMDRNIHIDAAVERVIGRWKGAVKEARIGRPGSAGRLSGQLSLSGEPLRAQNQTGLDQNLTHSGANKGRVQMSNGPDAMGSDPDADADADADMEEDDNFVEMAEAPLASGQRGTEAAMAQAASFRLANGYGSSTPHQRQGESAGRRPVIDRTALENHTCVGGYVRIGA